MPDWEYKQPKSSSTDLRSRAESILEQKSPSLDDVSKLSIEQIKNLVHELQTHQIELELQNEELRETQQELSKSRDAFIDLYDFAPVGYLTVSEKEIIVQANLTVAKMLVMDRGFLLKKPLSTLIARDDQDKYYLNMSQLNKEPTKTTWELHLKRSDNTVLEGQFQVSPILDIDGNFQHQFRVVISDITEIGEIQRRLRQNEATFRSVFDNSVDGIILGLPDGTVLRANPSACSVLGRTEVELRGLGRSGIFDLNDPRTPKHQERVMREGKSSEELNFIRKDGTLFPVEVASASFTGSDSSQRIIVSFKDITRRKVAEEKLKASEKRFKDLAELLPQGVFETDSEDRFTFTNSSHKHISGVVLDEDIIGKTPEEFVNPLEHHRVVEHIEAAKKGLFYEQEYMGWEQNGVRRPDILVKVAPIMTDSEVTGFRGVVTDITTLKQAEREKEALREQLFQAQKLASLGTLVGGIAHDFNNMLHVIIGYGEILMDEIEGKADTIPLKTMLQTSEEAAELVKKFMALGQQSMVIPEQIDLNDKIRELESLILCLPNIDHLETNLAPQPVTIKQGSDQLSQVIMNLAMNASEAMRDGGKLSLTTTNIMLDEDFCKDHVGVSHGPYVLLTVADTGRGMDETTLSRIFDPFFSTKERGNIKGMGLGLSVVRGIVQQQGGFVTCQSEVGKGTTFRVYFPEIEMPPSSDMPVTTIEPTVSKRMVLVVEDSTLVSVLEETALNAAGYKTILAANGKEAVKIFKEKHDEIVLVILDIIMPEMNGRDCLMELLKINPLLKVIVLSGDDPKSELSIAVKPYVMSFLPKPCKMSQLVEVVQLVMEG